MNLFDSQVNEGSSLRSGTPAPDCKLEEFIEKSPSNLVGAMVIPTPSHEIVYPTGELDVAPLWQHDGTNLNFLSRIGSEEKAIEIKNISNPYLAFNRYVLNRIRDVGSRYGKKLVMAAKIHPHLDTKEALIDILRYDEVKALKVHGIATASGPMDIPDWMIDISKERGVPFFIHTDFYSKEAKGFIYQLYQRNNPQNWVEWCLDKKVKAYLAHGLRGNIDLLRQISGNPSLLIGLGPDLLINSERERSFLEFGQDYLTEVLKNTNPSNLAWNTDYAWNTLKRNDWSRLDWNSHIRTINLAQELHLSQVEIEGIMYRNAMSFFKIQ